MKGNKLILLLLLLMGQYLYSQSVRASMDTSDVYVGQPFEYRITIEGTTDSTVPNLPDVPGITMKYKGASTSMVSSFGTGGSSSSKSITHSWTFIPLHTGDIAIPSFQISVDGKDFHTAAGTIHVKNAEEIEGFHLIMETDKKEYWKGEPILLTIRWLFSSSVSSPVFNLPFLNSGQFSAESQTPPSGNDVYKISINGLEVLAMQSAEVYKGDQYSTLSFQLKLQPKKAGVYDLGPVTLAFDISESTGIFQSSYKSAVIPSNKLSIKVKDLPEGTDSNIILSKGPLVIHSSADPGKVHIGDPITYKLEIEGAAVPEKVQFPSLKTFPSMNVNFNIPDRRSPGKKDGNKVVFTQTIRARKSGIAGIPQLELSYFDILSGKTEKTVIPAVPLEVEKTHVVTSADLESTGTNGQTQTSGPLPLESSDPGLLQNYSIEKITSRGVATPLIIVLLILPFSIFGGVLIYRYKAIIFNRKRNEDLESVFKIMKSRETRDEIHNDIRRYLHRYCEAQGEFLTSDELYTRILEKGNDRELCDKLLAMLMHMEELEYSGREIYEEGNIAEQFYSLCGELKA